MSWAHGDEIPGSSFQGMVNVLRKLFRAKQSHPQLAKTLKKFAFEFFFSLMLSDLWHLLSSEEQRASKT